MNSNNTLAIVVPCYNEEDAFPITVKSLTNFLGGLIRAEKVSKNSFLLFVDDGSKDKTWQLIEAETKQNPLVRGLKLSGNVGHQNALLAGLLTANEDSDLTVSIDADLQDDINAIEKMVDAYHDGADIVYGVRSDRKSDSVFKRTTAQGFYKLMSAMGVKTVYNHADFRLMSHRAVEALSQYKERNLFLRGIVPLIGFKTESVYYERAKRVAGESKYPLKKMLKFAFDGITSFSVKPISLITALGIIIIICSIAAFIYTLVSYFTGNTEPGWASLIISIWFLGGVQLSAIGIVGQYIGKIYVESKERPRYNIEKYVKYSKEQ
ncbi:MAG: glycosyltransferase family 2 protein [Clostridia bacterium]|nr:glycosyltransferase family 2 protein [Clostridia bacterium]MBQ7108052.1 glycosyltransferase family 2 protein [Clostridia bacterium]MBQ9919312.1 glycosyltransferase family 2 protein [Clostridia bacterium]